MSLFRRRLHDVWSLERIGIDAPISAITDFVKSGIEDKSSLTDLVKNDVPAFFTESVQYENKLYSGELPGRKMRQKNIKQLARCRIPVRTFKTETGIKTCILLFICAVMRAVHLEQASQVHSYHALSQAWGPSLSISGILIRILNGAKWS